MLSNVGGIKSPISPLVKGIAILKASYIVSVQRPLNVCAAGVARFVGHLVIVHMV